MIENSCLGIGRGQEELPKFGKPSVLDLRSLPMRMRETGFPHG